MTHTTSAAAGLAALAGAALPASAQPLIPIDPKTLDLPAARGDGGPRNAPGDLYGAAITIHSASGYDFLDSAPDVHIFGGTSFAGLSSLDAGRAVYATTSETQVGPGSHRFVVEWSMGDGGAFIAPGATLGEDTITAIGFHLGEGSAPSQPIDWSHPGELNIISAAFELIDLAGEDVLAGAGVFDISEHAGSGFSGTAFYGGNDLALLGVTLARVTVTTGDVPAPAGAALLAAGGALACRRRRPAPRPTA